MFLPDNHLYEFGNFVLDARSRILLRVGGTVHLTPKAFDILLVLVQHGGQVVDKGLAVQFISRRKLSTFFLSSFSTEVR